MAEDEAEEKRKAGFSLEDAMPPQELIEHLMDQIDANTMDMEGQPSYFIINLMYSYLSRLFAHEELPPAFLMCSSSFFDPEHLEAYHWHRVYHARMCEEWYDYPADHTACSLLPRLLRNEPHCDPVPVTPYDWTTYWEQKDVWQSATWRFPLMQVTLPSLSRSAGMTQFLALAQGVFWTSQKPVYLYWAYLLAWHPAMSSALGDFLLALLLAVAAGGGANPTFTHWCFRMGTTTPGFAVAWRRACEPLGFLWCRDDTFTPAIEWPRALTPELIESWAFICGSHFPTTLADDDLHALRDWARTDLTSLQFHWPAWMPWSFQKYLQVIEPLLTVPGHAGWEHWMPFTFLKRALVLQTILLVGLSHRTPQENSSSVDFPVLRKICVKAADQANQALILQKHQQILSLNLNPSHDRMPPPTTSPRHEGQVFRDDDAIQLP